MKDVPSKPSTHQRIAVRCIKTFNSLNETMENLDPYCSFVMRAAVALEMQRGGAKFRPDDDYILQDFRKHGVEMDAQDHSLKTLIRFHDLALEKFMLKQATDNVIVFCVVK